MREEIIGIRRAKSALGKGVKKFMEDNAEAVTGQKIIEQFMTTLRELEERFGPAVNDRILYYISNEYIPRRDSAGEVVFYKIPTSVFAVTEDEKARIIEPVSVWAIHPSNFIRLTRMALDLRMEVREWDWSKMKLRDQISDDLRGI